MAATPKAPPREPQKCAICPKRFTPSRKGHMYCSTACKGRAQAYRFALAGGRR
jgi:hypothetical protein